MAKRLIPLSLDRIDEGLFKQRIEESIAKARQELVAFAREHGALAEKAKAVVTCKVTLECVNPSDGSYSVKGETSLKLPGPPSSVTMAVHGESQTGDDELQVWEMLSRPSGSDGSNPRQQKLATQDGRIVDVDTGEVKDPPAAPRKAKE